MVRSNSKLGLSSISASIVYDTEVIDGKEVTLNTINVKESLSRLEECFTSYNLGRYLPNPVKGSSINPELVKSEFSKVVGTTLMSSPVVQGLVAQNVMSRLLEIELEEAKAKNIEPRKVGSYAEVLAAINLMHEECVQSYTKDMTLQPSTQYIVFKGKGGGIVNLEGGLAEIARRKA